MSEEKIQVGLTGEEIDHVLELIDRELQGAQALITLMNKFKAARSGATRPPGQREQEPRRG